MWTHKYLQMGKCQRKNNASNEHDPRTSCLACPRAPRCWGASSSAQHLGHDAGHTPGLCGWPPCGRRLQWRAASTLHPFPPKFLLVRALSHPAGQPGVTAALGVSQALCWAGQWGQGWPKAHGKGAEAIIDWGSALGLSPWPPVGQGCPHGL